MPDMKGAAITWLGHATVLIQTPKGTNVLIDPWIKKNPSHPKGYKLPKKVDLVLLTHGHFDHTGDAIAVAKKHKPTVVGAFELTSFLESQGVKNTTGMNLGGAFTFEDVTVTMVEAKHSSSIQDGEKTVYAGNAAGYVLRLTGGPVIYDTGDTAVYSDMQLIGELYAPEIAILPIGGYYTMGPMEAARAIQMIGAKTVIPVHYGTFPMLKGTPGELRSALAQRGVSGVELVDLSPGETVQ